MTANTTQLFYSAYEILNTTYEPPVWIVPDLLPAGLAILGGAAKVGKSWLALQLALSVGSGGVFLGRPVNKEKVLYLALEDNSRRMQDRMNLLKWPNNPSIQVSFMYLSEFKANITPLQRGGTAALRDIVENFGFKLVVIDTLSRALLGIRDMNDNPEITKALSPLQEMSMALNCAILFLDHHPKSVKGELANPINDIFGSQAKGALVDTAWGLYKSRGLPGAKFMIAGRDVMETELDLKWDRLTACWQNLTPSAGIGQPLQLTPLETKIKDFIEQFGRPTYTDIWKFGGFVKSSVWEPLQHLRSMGEIDYDGVTHEYYI